jgi:hypothetical protein
VNVVTRSAGNLHGRFAGVWRAPSGVVDPHAIRIEAGGSSARVSVGDIDWISSEATSSGAFTGASVGLAVDLSLLVVMAVVVRNRWESE